MSKARRFLKLLIKNENTIIGYEPRIVKVCYASHWKEAEAEAGRLGALYEQEYPELLIPLVYSWRELKKQYYSKETLKIYNHDNFLEGLSWGDHSSSSMGQPSISKAEDRPTQKGGDHE